jgi:hypothetical protein
MSRNTSFSRIGASLVLAFSAAALCADEDEPTFLDSVSKDAALTNANWSIEEQTLFLAWRSAASAGLVNNESGVGTQADDTRSIALGDLNNDGDLDVVAGNHTVASLVYLNNGNGTFVPPTASTTLGANATQSVVLGDVDGDGDLDIAMGNYNELNRLYLNNGGGAFSASSTIGLDADATRSISLGDVDGDGDLDLVAGTDHPFQTNKLYLNNGNGVFGVGSPIGVAGNITTSTILLDVDRDGDLDLAIANNTASVGTPNRLYKNNGAGGFTSTGINIGSLSEPTTSLAAGDVDNDGDIDFISGNNGSVNRVHKANGDNFSSNDLEIGGGEVDATTSVSLADTDNDGDLDLIVGNMAGYMKRYINDGDGGFANVGEVIWNGAAAASSYSTHSSALGDMDGDGDIDIVTGENGFNKLYLNTNGGGGFAATGTAIASETDNTLAVVLGDVNNDTFLDLIAGNAGQTNKLYLNDGSGGFPEVGVDIGSTTDVTYSLALADVDGVNGLDLIVGNWGTTNKLYLNGGSIDLFSLAGGDGDGSAIGSEEDVTTSIAVGDVDGANGLDVVVGNWGQENKLYLHDGVGGFSPATNIGTETDNTTSIALVDVDEVNLVDVIVGNSDQVNKYYLNNGSGVFPVTGLDIGPEVDDTRSIVSGDVDGINGPDLIFGNSNETNKLYLNTGSGFPAEGTPVGATEQDVTTSVLLFDVDADGDLDLLTGNDGTPNKRYLNNGSGGFSTVGAPLNPGSIVSTRALALGDLDGTTDEGNTDVDLVAAEYGTTNKVYKNTLYQTHLGRVISNKMNTTETNFRGVFLSATSKVNLTATYNTRIDYYLSNNGGAKWYRVQSDKLFSFPQAGSDLRWKAELHSLSPIRTPVLSDVIVEINIPPVIGGGDTRQVSVAGGETAVTTVVGTDEDGAVLFYGIDGGDDEEKFEVDIISGVLTFIVAPDFSAPTDSNGDNVYHVRVKVEDSGAGNPIDTQDIFVTVTEPVVPWIDDGGGANSIWWLSLLMLLCLKRKRSELRY